MPRPSTGQPTPLAGGLDFTTHGLSRASLRHFARPATDSQIAHSGRQFARLT
ncbi:hypothetical protein [Silvimonas amylolytica]|uniref:hypothetical protein n=1 Tax=Silvimonas amylolytica TaxID=449663 RepID=UPI001E62D16E|nr:hypothetical protein [Silvimonas amylolytica]